jgi:hypothetical protein
MKSTPLIFAILLPLFSLAAATAQYSPGGAPLAGGGARGGKGKGGAGKGGAGKGGAGKVGAMSGAKAPMAKATSNRFQGEQCSTVGASCPRGGVCQPDGMVNRCQRCTSTPLRHFSANVCRSQLVPGQARPAAF